MDRYAAWTDDLFWFHTHSPQLTEGLVSAFCRRMHGVFPPAERRSCPIMLEALRRRMLADLTGDWDCAGAGLARDQAALGSDFSTKSVEKAVA